jgi:hypothetical protein
MGKRRQLLGNPEEFLFVEGGTADDQHVRFTFLAPPMAACNDSI